MWQVPKNTDLGADAERVRKEEQSKIDEAEILTEEELTEKEELLKEVGWSKESRKGNWLSIGLWYIQINNISTSFILFSSCFIIQCVCVCVYIYYTHFILYWTGIYELE